MLWLRGSMVMLAIAGHTGHRVHLAIDSHLRTWKGKMCCLPKHDQLTCWGSSAPDVMWSVILFYPSGKTSLGWCWWLVNGSEKENKKFSLHSWKHESLLLGNQGQDVMFNSPPFPADLAATWRPWRSSTDRKQAQFQTIPSKVLPVFDGHG